MATLVAGANTQLDVATALGVLDMPVTFEQLLSINTDGTHQFWDLGTAGGLSADLTIVNAVDFSTFSVNFIQLQLHTSGTNEASPVAWTLTNIPLSAQGTTNITTGAVSVTIPDLFQMSFNILAFDPNNPLAGVTYGFLNGNTSFVPFVLRGADTITGSSLNDRLLGFAGNDTLNGGAGADTMLGGVGNDTYVVNSTLDLVTEALNAGTDLVQSTAAAHTLAANVENLTLLGIANINGTGNTLNNVLTGNTGNNVLNGGVGADTMAGGAGNDTYVVNSTLDVVTEGSSAGTDLVQSTAAAHTLSVNVENLTLLGSAAINGTGNSGNNVLTGNSANNVLNGGSGNDTLNGGIGADTMAGGAGNDTYVVNSTLDVVTEGLNAGTDLVQSTAAAHTLSANVENLTLLGTSAINGTGNSLNNLLTGNGGNNVLNGSTGTDTASYASAAAGVTVSLAVTTIQNTLGAGSDTLTSIENLTGSALNDTLTGNSSANTLDGGAGNDSLNGGAGNDTLIGGLGNDTLIGGTGADAFVFNSALGATNIDTISGYSVLDDTIRLENAIFTNLVTPGALAAVSFRSGAGLTGGADANDFVIYNSTTGQLFYDAGGNTGAASVQFATLLGAPASVTAADFLVI